MYNELAKKEVVDETIKNLAANNVEGIFVATKEEALAKIKELIPAHASLMNGASVTLEQIGFVDVLQKKEHTWNNLHDGVLAEQDPAKKLALRKQAVTSDYYLGSVHALAQTGQFIIASNTGSQLGHIVFTSPNLIFVVGAQKIVPNLDEAFKRLHEYVIPLEEVHMQQKYGVGTFPSKVVVFNRENPIMKRSVKMIIVNEALGF